MAVASTFCMSGLQDLPTWKWGWRSPKNMTEFVKQPPDTPKEKCDGKCKIKMVSPAQVTAGQAKSEAKQLRETPQGKAPQSSTKRPRGQNSVKPKKKKRKYNGTVFQNGVF